MCECLYLYLVTSCKKIYFSLSISDSLMESDVSQSCLKVFSIPELLAEIFSYLDFISIKHSLTVCKSWKDELDRQLWKKAILKVTKDNLLTVEKFMNVPAIKILGYTKGYPPIRRCLFTIFTDCTILQELHLSNVNFNKLEQFPQPLLVKLISKLKVVEIIKCVMDNSTLTKLYQKIIEKAKLKKMKIVGKSHRHIPLDLIVETVKTLNRMEMLFCRLTDFQFSSLKPLASMSRNKSSLVIETFP